ncbi:MAG: hypothetical protein KGQ66_04655 [Acidobacteriota bacterium]|nr:hypothetical protein [Acidobacteriota bacterium]
MTPQKLASEVVSAFPRGGPASPQNMWRMFVFDYVEAAFGKSGSQHGLPRDINLVLDHALDQLRLSLDLPDFVPQTV